MSDVSNPMGTSDILSKQLYTFESALLKGLWPLPDSSGADYFLDVGLDPSMASSGACAILRKKHTVLSATTLHHKTDPHTPTPLRLSSVGEAVAKLINEAAVPVPSGHLHITLLFEIPPMQMSSSGWLYALNQFLWVGFSPDSPAFAQLRARGIRVTFHHWAIGVTQLKHLYHQISEKYGLGHTYKDIKSTKSVVVAVISRMLQDTPLLKEMLPKRFNNDVAEGIALACLAGGTTKLQTFPMVPCDPPYASVDLRELHQLMTSREVNKKSERMGWVFRPMVHCFGWDTTTL